MKQTLTVFTLALLLTACGSKSKWTANDKENAYKACMFGKLPELNDEQMKKRCDCYLEKVMELSPDPVEQSKISMDKVLKLNADCLEQAKK
jgi:major membrane immunogen (membrane-anchored lipoprotein)